MQSVNPASKHACWGIVVLRSREFATWGLLCLLFVSQAGCSCSSSSGPRGRAPRQATAEQIEAARQHQNEQLEQERKEREERRQREEAEKRKQLEEHRQRVEAERIKREQQQREWQAKVQEEQQQKAEPPKPQFPENPADWTKDDFPKAREAGDPKLVDAVNHLGEMFPTSEPAVAALVTLLKPAGPPADQKLIEAIVQALGRNKTGTATRALRDLVDGKVETELPSVARSGAMRMLAERDASLFDELLLIALRAADDDQRRGGATAALDWEGELLRLIEDRASPPLRVRVAHYAMEVGTSARQREKLLALLTRPAPANLSAQVVLLAGSATGVAAKAALARQLAMVGSCILQRLLGLPASVTPAFAAGGGEVAAGGGVPGTTSFGGPAPVAAAKGGGTSLYDDPNLLRYGPPALWSDTAVSMVSESLFQIERLDQAPQLLQVAATMPVKAVRQRLLETLGRNWHDGPGGLRSAGVPGQIIFDPVLPVLLRCLPHTTPDMGDWRRHLFAAGAAQGVPGQWHPVHRQKQHEAVMEYAWAQLLGETTWTMCTRLQAAAEAALGVQGLQATVEAAASYSPIPLHENARVVAFHQASLPGAAGGSTDDGFSVDPTTVRYVRMVDNVPLRKTFLHYTRQISKPAVFADQRSAWIGGLEPSDSDGTVRSIDVFITRTSNLLHGLTDVDERLVIQVLCVECADPRGDEDGAAPAASTSEAGSGPADSATLTEN